MATKNDGKSKRKRSRNPASDAPVQLYWELDWNRVLYVNSPIDDDFVSRAAPEILKLKQASPAPITVAIDSPGGFLSSLGALHGLLRSPGQRGETWQIYTVAVNHAESAAATLLALGDYAIAYPHSKILFHPVRLDGNEWTAERAIDEGSGLGRQDDEYALWLATTNLTKIVGSFDELRRPKLMEEARKRYPVEAESFGRTFGYILEMYGCPDPEVFNADLAGFAVSLWANLDYPADGIVQDAVTDLLRLVQARALLGYARVDTSGAAPADVRVGALRHKLRNLLDAAERMPRHGDQKEGSSDPKGQARRLEELESIAALVIRRVASGDLSLNAPIDLSSLGLIERESTLLRAMHRGMPVAVYDDLVFLQQEEFLPAAGMARLKGLTPKERVAVEVSHLRPQREVLWWLFRLMYRRLFMSENALHARHAQLLGLIDEVAGFQGRIPSPNEKTIMEARAAKGAKAPGA